MGTVKMKKIFPYAGILSASIYFYYLASKIEFVGRSGALGPDFWPETILLLTMIACLYEIIKIVFFSRNSLVRKTEATNPGGKGEAAEDPPKSYRPLLVAGIVLTMAYAYSIELAGFLLSTFLYLVLFMLVGRYRKMGVILASSAIGTLVIAFVFIRLVYISLPQGQGPFSTISYFILGLMGIK
jgi:hypothetical protein